MSKLHLATFRVDATVPIGHSLCGGWIKPAMFVAEPLEAHGIVLLGNEAPVVLLTVDWTGICNASYDRLCEVVAKAAHTSTDRVAVHAVHQHNAPFVDESGQEIIRDAEKLPPIVNVDWAHTTFDKIAKAVRDSLARTQPLTHVGTGSATVEKVACNRRIVGRNGKLTGWRGSSCKEAKLRAEPDGLIDPQLRTISFWSDKTMLTALHFYAVHPMSYYGDGLVTSDFVGLARSAATKETGVPQIYLTGCAGNIAAGKYNDGDMANRFLLARRVNKAMNESLAGSAKKSVDAFSWHTSKIRLPPRSDEPEKTLLDAVHNVRNAGAVRGRAAMKLAYRRRVEAGHDIALTCLRLNDTAAVVSLPAESFIEFQLDIERQFGQQFVGVAAYSQGGPWYIPIAKAYIEGGYEPSASFVDPESEQIMNAGLKRLLQT